MRRRPGQVRVPVRVPALTETVDSPGPPDVGEAQDLSAGGIALRLAKAVVLGAAVRVTLRLRRRAPLSLAGKVVWVRPHPDLPGWMLGIQFGDELSGEMVAEIADEEHPPWAPAAR
jgi:PilZ domain